MQFFLKNLVSCVLFSCLLLSKPAYANPVFPLPTSTGISNIEEIQVSCANSWLAPDRSRVRYKFTDGTPNEDYDEFETDTDFPTGSFCGTIFSQFGGESENSSIPPETIEWWQAAILLAEDSMAIGAIVYPLAFVVRFVSIIVYS